MLTVIVHVVKFLLLYYVHKFALICIVHIINVILCLLRCCLA